MHFYQRFKWHALCGVKMQKGKKERQKIYKQLKEEGCQRAQHQVGQKLQAEPICMFSWATPHGNFHMGCCIWGTGTNQTVLQFCSGTGIMFLVQIALLSSLSFSRFRIKFYEILNSETISFFMFPLHSGSCLSMPASRWRELLIRYDQIFFFDFIFLLRIESSPQPFYRSEWVKILFSVDRIFLNPYRLSCRMKLEILLCLKCRERTFYSNIFQSLISMLVLSSFHLITSKFQGSCIRIESTSIIFFTFLMKGLSISFYFLKVQLFYNSIDLSIRIPNSGTSLPILMRILTNQQLKYALAP